MTESTIRRAPPAPSGCHVDRAPPRPTAQHDLVTLQVDRLRRRFQLSDPLAKALAPIVFGEAPR